MTQNCKELKLKRSSKQVKESRQTKLAKPKNSASDIKRNGKKPSLVYQMHKEARGYENKSGEKEQVIKGNVEW